MPMVNYLPRLCAFSSSCQLISKISKHLGIMIGSEQKVHVICTTKTKVQGKKIVLAIHKYSKENIY